VGPLVQPATAGRQPRLSRLTVNVYMTFAAGYNLVSDSDSYGMFVMQNDQMAGITGIMRSNGAEGVVGVWLRPQHRDIRTSQDVRIGSLSHR
jgi:hypothetical protein